MLTNCYTFSIGICFKEILLLLKRLKKNPWGYMKTIREGDSFIHFCYLLWLNTYNLWRLINLFKGHFFQGKTQYISGIHDIAVLRKMGNFLSGRVFAALLHISRKIVHWCMNMNSCVMTLSITPRYLLYHFAFFCFKLIMESYFGSWACTKIVIFEIVGRKIPSSSFEWFTNFLISKQNTL